MPDTFIPANIVGNNSASLAAMRLDSFERMNKAFSGFNAPKAYPNEPIADVQVPSYSQRDLFDLDISNKRLTDGLYSQDPEVRNKAYATLEQMSYNSPTGKGLGTSTFVPYDKSQDKYLKGDFGYNPYVSMQENEDFNYKFDYMEHGVLGRTFRNIGTGLGRFIGSVAAKTVQTFGYLGSMIGNGIEELVDPTGNNAMADIADNSLSRWAEGWEEDMKSSNLLSVFKPNGWEDMGFFQKLGQGAFWTDEIADGAAFMGEMILTTYLTGGLGKAAGLGKLGATSINMASKLGKVGKGLDFITKLATGAQDISGIGRWALNTTSEAAMEASEGYKSVKKTLQEDRAKGLNTLTDDQIEKQAGDRAAARFRGNLLVLSVSNAFENKFIFEPIFGKARKAANPLSKNIDISNSTNSLDELAEATRRKYNYKTKLGKVVNWKDPNSRLRFYGSRALQSTAMEGFWEENAQLAIERLSATDTLSTGSFFNKLLKQTKDALKGDDHEASESIGLGGVIGILGTGVTSKVGGERRQVEKATKDTINTYNDYRKKFLSFQDIYKRDAEGKIELDEYGDMVVDEVKATAVMDGVKQFSNRQAALDTIKDPLLKKNLQDDLMSDYIYAAKKAGIFDKVVDRFKNLSNVDTEQLKELGFDPNTIVDATSMSNSIQEFGKDYDEAFDNDVKYPANEESDNETRKLHLFKAKARLRAATKSADEYQKAFDSVPVESPFAQSVNAQTSDVHMYNSILQQITALEQFEQMTSEHGDFYKGFNTAEKARLNERKTELRKLVQSKIDDGKLKESEEGILYSPVKYAQFSEEEAQEMMKQELTTQQKHAQLSNTSAQQQFLVDKLSSFEKGWDNYQDYKKYIESIQKKDEAIDATEPSNKTEDADFEVVREENKQIAPATEPVKTSTNFLAEINSAYERLKTEGVDGVPAFLEFVQKNSGNQMKSIADFFMKKAKEVGEAYKANPSDEKVSNTYYDFVELIDTIDKNDEEGDALQITEPIINYIQEVEEFVENNQSEEEQPIQEPDGEKENAATEPTEEEQKVPENNSIESKKADIEKRRQEDLKYIDDNSFALEGIVKDFNREIDSLREGLKGDKNAIDNLIERRKNQSPVELINKNIAFFQERLSSALGNEAKSALETSKSQLEFVQKFNIQNFTTSIDDVKAQVNKKYDDELAALEGKSIINPEVSNNETKQPEEKQEPIETDEARKERLATDIAMSRVGPYSFYVSEEDKKFYNENQDEIEKIVEGEVERMMKEMGNQPDVQVPTEDEDERDNNKIDTLVDAAKKEGKFTFVSNAAHEIVTEGKPVTENDLKRLPAKVTDGALVLKSAVGDQTIQALRQRNVLKKYGNSSIPENFWEQTEDGKPKFKIKLIHAGERREDQYKDWVFWNVKGMLDNKGVPYKFPFILAVITDGNGNPHYFDVEGNIVTDKTMGQPVAFSYSVNEYLAKNITSTRRATMVPGDYSTLRTDYQTDSPMDTIRNLVLKGIPVMASIDMVTAGQLSNLNSINSPSNAQKSKEPELRSLKDMIESGDLVWDNDVRMLVQSAGDTMINVEGENGAQVQTIRKGMPYIQDKKSGYFISLRGKKLKDLTFEGKSITEGPLKAILEELYKKNEVFFEDGNPEQVQQIYDFLKAVFYSKDITLKLRNDGLAISYIDHRPNHEPLLDYEMNMNTSVLEKGGTLMNPFSGPNFGKEEESYRYEDFLLENLLSGAIPAHVSTGLNGEKVKNFEKLNRRIIFTLDKSEKELLNTVNAQPPVKAPIVVTEDEHTQFVGKKYKTAKGTMEILEFDEAKNQYVYKDETGKERRTSKETFAKNFPKMTEITTVKPSEEVKEEMASKEEADTNLSKQEVDEILGKVKSMTEEDLNNIEFDNC